MTFDEAMREAARVANRQVREAMWSMERKAVFDEDDLNGYIIGRLDVAFSDRTIGGLRWGASILRHRGGKAAHEERVGADMLIHVSLDTPTQCYSKGVLIQAKKNEPHEEMTIAERLRLTKQCASMLKITPAAFVLAYSVQGARCDSATKVAGADNRDLHDQCSWTSYRFFRELFRCPIGDPKITSELYEDLPTIRGVSLKARGDLTDS